MILSQFEEAVWHRRGSDCDIAEAWHHGGEIVSAVEKADGIPISDVAATFGVSRPTFYKAQDTIAAAGLAGLLPRPRGPKGGHKISAEVVAFVVNLKAATPELTTPQCLAAVETSFGIKVHRRSLERALARKKKALGPP
jgi:transposase